MKAQGTQLSLFQARSTGESFAVRVSARARRLTARVHVGGRVEIVVPVGVKPRAVRDFVQRFTPWIDRKVAAMQCFAEPAASVPTRIDFG
jgi:predicted metal-dependent hydrolase